MRHINKIISLFCILICTSNCKNDTDDIIWIGLDSKKNYTIQELHDVIDISKYHCDDTIKEKGQYANVCGYVQKINVNYNKSRFALFSQEDNSISAVFNQQVLDVKVNKSDSAHIFSTLENCFKEKTDNSYLHISVTSEIYDWNMAGDGWCKKAIALIAYDISIIE